jgi:NTP pyrophosphatase (non-canonical NTP hydrolase)
MEISELQKEVHLNAVKHGWWEGEANIPEKLALIHSEISEALEDYRKERMTPRLVEDNKPEGFPVELADVIIRTLDLAEALGFNLEYFIKEKHEFNKKRSYRHGGKVC